MSIAFTRGLRLAVAILVLLAATPFAGAAVNVGDRPPIQFRSLQGQPVTNEALTGKLVIVDFWATWCGPCVASMPEMIALDRAYRDKGVQIIGVSLDNGPREVQRFIQARGMGWPQAFEGAQRMAQEWGVRGIPRVFLISPQGEVLWTGHPAQMKPAFEKALQTHPPVPPEPEVSAEAIATASEAIGEARKAIDAKDYAALLAAIAEVPDEALEDRRLLGQARVLSNKLRIQADPAALDSAKQASTEAAAKLERLLAPVAPKPLSDAAHVIAPPAGGADAAAARKLEQAEKQHEAGEYAAAYKGYGWIVERAGETAAASTAAERVAAYEADAEIMAKIQTADAEAAARSAFAMARNYEAAGKLDLAKSSYREIVTDHAGTPAAAEAQARLDALK